MPDQETVIITEQPANKDFNPYDTSAWSDKPIEQTGQPKTEATAETPATPETSKPAESTAVVAAEKQESDEEIIEPNEWLQREYGVDAAKLKEEREEYKKFKEQQPFLEFADEQSKQIHELIRQGKRKEVREYLETQERLDAFTSGEINKDNASEIIKLGMQLSNKLLTKDEVEFQYRQEFSTPKQPKQAIGETDEDFEEKMEEWKEAVSIVEMKRTVAAKMAIPKLQELKQSIKLPDIERPIPQQVQPSQEELAKLESIRSNFLKKLESDYSKVDGFSTSVKVDESVSLPVSFKIPDESKVEIKQRLQDFDVNSYIDTRWFDDNGAPKIDQIISDIYELENRDKVHSAIANDAAAKRLEAYIKSQKNIDLNNGTPQQTFNPKPPESMTNPYSESAWSEKPIIQN